MTEVQVQMLRAMRLLIDTLLGEEGAAQGNGANIADDGDLDGKYGDPQVKFNPRDWHGDSCKGLTMSQCPAEFLDLLAGTFDYFAKQAEKNNETTSAGKPVAPYRRKDAARARGWAARKRNGWKGAAVADAGGGQWASAGAGFDVSGFEDVTNDNDVPF